MNKNTVTIGLIISGFFLSMIPMSFIYGQSSIITKVNSINNETEGAIAIIENITKSAMAAGATITKNATENVIAIVERNNFV